MSFKITQYTELQLIPVEYRTVEICKQMVNKEIYNIIFVPDNVIEPTMVDVQNRYLKDIFKNIPDEYKTQAICDKAVELDALNIEFVPNTYRNAGMILSAYTKNKNVIKFIPEGDINTEIYLEAVGNGCIDIETIPEAQKTKEMYNAAATKTSKTLEEFLELIPEESKTAFIDEDLYVSWLKSTGMTSFDQIPEDVKLKSFYEKTLILSVNTLKHMPVEMFDPITMKIEESADFYSNFAAIPSSYKTPTLQGSYDNTSEFWTDRLKSSGYNRAVFESMPSQYKTELVFKMFVFKKDTFD